MAGLFESFKAKLNDTSCAAKMRAAHQAGAAAGSPVKRTADESSLGGRTSADVKPSAITTCHACGKPR
jgi:hypothetical protein